MLATLVTAVVRGLRGELIRVEVDVAPGLPVFHLVGLPDTALSEARERVRAAVRNSGFQYPLSRITVNLAPAERRKTGAAYDVAIGVGILLASAQIRAGGGSWALLGELSLGGEVLPVPGVLPMVATLARAGHIRVAVPAANLPEATLVAGVEARPLEGLDDAARLVAGCRGRRAAAARRRSSTGGAVAAASSPGVEGPLAAAVHSPVADASRPVTVSDRRLLGDLVPVDLGEVRGQATARWALEVALVGGHNLLLVGPPGAGKTLLARTIPGLLPPLSEEEALEHTVIESVAGLLDGEAGLRRRRPFRAPHHTSSYAALVGGGPRLAPGEVTLAHLGVLFLDELAEFDRAVLDALRQPLEEGSIEISRAHGQVRYPARVQLVAAMNPCRCGYHGDPERPCRCAQGDPERYVRRISGPLLDRLDVRLRLARVPPEELLDAPAPEDTATVSPRIAAARARAVARNGGRVNAALTGAETLRVARLDRAAAERVRELAAEHRFSARAIHRLLRVALSVADARAAERVDEAAVLAALSFREPEGGLFPSLAA